MKRRYTQLILFICALLFITALWGSVSCGSRLSHTDLPPEKATQLRQLIYFHFALAQIAILGAVLCLYGKHRRWRKYYLLVSYNEKGMKLSPPGISMPQERVYRCHLGNLGTAELPPADAPILVYPMFMLSGHSSGAKLEHELQAAYAARNCSPKLYYQPVLGASPWLAKAAAELLRPKMTPDTGVLVVAHGSRLTECPPEPALFCRRLRDLLPGTEIALGYFSQAPAADDALRHMKSERIMLLPFLLTEGLHTQRDLPTEQQAAACGKQLCRLPVLASLIDQENIDL